MSCFSFHGMAERETRRHSGVRYCKRWSEWLESTLTRPGREFGGRVGSNPTTMCNLMIMFCAYSSVVQSSGLLSRGSQVRVLLGAPDCFCRCYLFSRKSFWFFLMPWYSSNWSGSNSKLDALSIRMMRSPMRRQWSRYPQHRHQFCLTWFRSLI